MPQEQVSITFYKIDKCGYYEQGEETPEFGYNISDIFNQLSAWVADKELKNTGTFNETERYKQTYCYSLKKLNGRYLLVTWNAVPNSEGNVAAVRGNELVGKPTVEEATFSNEDAIPGYATYFYFIPADNIFATILFSGQLNGQQAMVRYLSNYLKYFSEHVVKGSYSNGTGYKHLGFKEGLNDFDPVRRLKACFSTSLMRNEGKIDEIRDRIRDIRKLESRTTLKYEATDDKDATDSLLEGLLALVNANEPDEDRYTSVGLSYSMTFRPTEEELANMIEHWSGNMHIDGEDVGFKMEGDNSTYWLGKSLARTSYEIDITRSNDHIVDPTLLLQELFKNEREIRVSVEP